MSCKCHNVALGSYGNQVVLDRPAHMLGRTEGSSNQESICVDTCIATRIGQLWSRGIRTTGCCCGHGDQPAYVGVIVNDIEMMMALGFQVLDNESRPGAMDSFVLEMKL